MPVSKTQVVPGYRGEGTEKSVEYKKLVRKCSAAVALTATSCTEEKNNIMTEPLFAHSAQLTNMQADEHSQVSLL